ncbi:hypothetical protein CSA37_04205 [Candidatus Fermentibacteria bacterium]|nr:MAG: hypothetical protein CSA37_04205 [Candidatus Fermentibacteria bacterium]
MFKTVLILLAVFGATSLYAYQGTAERIHADQYGIWSETATGQFLNIHSPEPIQNPPEVLWHYSLETGMQQKCCPMGYNCDFVFTGGWYGGAVMFQGKTGDGTPQWNYEPQTYSDWTSLGTGTCAAKTQDVFFAVQNWDSKAANTAVMCFESSSSTPLWIWSDPSFNSGAVDSPGKFACSDDGAVFAVGGVTNGHLAIHFFSPGSSTPFASYENTDIQYSPRQLRITSDGSKCIFRVSATLYRVDTATGTLEAQYALDASNDCFGISPDGSVVAYGFTAARIAVWNGSEYQLSAGTAVSGYYGGAAAVAADNNTVYFGFYKNTYKTNRIIRFDLNAGSVSWTYDYPAGSGGYQDVMKWMECTPDGRWMVAGSWGCENGGGDEVNVFYDLYPESPVFSIDTPGSISHVDISPDGRYITASGKHVHANQMGSGTDVYMGEVYFMGTGGSEPVNLAVSVYPNPAQGAFSVNAVLPETGSGVLNIYDFAGRCVYETPVAGSGQIAVSEELPAGVYNCLLNSSAGTAAARIVLID